MSGNVSFSYENEFTNLSNSTFAESLEMCLWNIQDNDTSRLSLRDGLLF